MTPGVSILWEKKKLVHEISKMSKKDIEEWLPGPGKTSSLTQGWGGEGDHSGMVLTFDF